MPRRKVTPIAKRKNPDEEFELLLKRLARLKPKMAAAGKKASAA